LKGGSGPSTEQRTLRTGGDKKLGGKGEERASGRGSEFCKKARDYEGEAGEAQRTTISNKVLMARGTGERITKKKEGGGSCDPRC